MKKHDFQENIRFIFGLIFYMKTFLSLDICTFTNFHYLTKEAKFLRDVEKILNCVCVKRLLPIFYTISVKLKLSKAATFSFLTEKGSCQ